MPNIYSHNIIAHIRLFSVPFKLDINQMKNMSMFVGEEEENIYVKSVGYAVKSPVC